MIIRETLLGNVFFTVLYLLLSRLLQLQEKIHSQKIYVSLSTPHDIRGWGKRTAQTYHLTLADGLATASDSYSIKIIIL